MIDKLPEGVYNVDNGKFALTDKFESIAKEQGLTIEATKSLRSELEQFYGPGKKLHALEPYMKETIKRKLNQALEQLLASKALKGITINQESTVIPVAQKVAPTKEIPQPQDNPSIQNVLFGKLGETIKNRNDALKNI